MPDIRKTYTRREFLRAAAGTALLGVPLVSACAKATEEPVVVAPTSGGADTGGAPSGGEGTGRAPGQRGGMWLPPEPPEITEIVTAVDTSSYFTNIMWRIMIDRGFVYEEGFTEVTPLVADGTLEGLVSKDIFIVGNLDADNVAASISEGLPVRAVATHRNHEWHIGGLSPSIKKPGDLIGGKAICGSLGSRTNAQFRDHVLAWSAGEVDIVRDMEHITVSGGSDSRQEALIADQVQLANIYPRHLEGLKEGGAGWAVYGWFEWPQEAITVHTDSIANTPRAVTNILRAYLKALNVFMDFHERKQVEADMLANQEMELSDAFRKEWPTQVGQYAMNGTFGPDAMKIFLDDLAKFDILPADTLYEQFYDTTFLNLAQVELLGMATPAPKMEDIFTANGFPLRTVSA